MNEQKAQTKPAVGLDAVDRDVRRRVTNEARNDMWAIEWHNYTGPNDGYHVEWWNVTNGEKTLRPPRAARRTCRQIGVNSPTKT